MSPGILNDRGNEAVGIKLQILQLRVHKVFLQPKAAFVKFRDTLSVQINPWKLYAAISAKLANLCDDGADSVLRRAEHASLAERTLKRFHAMGRPRWPMGEK